MIFCLSSFIRESLTAVVHKLTNLVSETGTAELMSVDAKDEAKVWYLPSLK